MAMTRTVSWAILLVVFVVLSGNAYTYLRRSGQWIGSTSGSVATDTKKAVELVGGAVAGGVESTVQGAIRGAQTEMGISSADIEQSPDETVERARSSIVVGSALPHRNELKRHSDAQSQVGKDGYCLVGQEGLDGRPRRACVRVGVNDRCLSNKIYPTMAVCVNPSLRA